MLPNDRALSDSTLYLPHLSPLTAEALRQAARLEALPGYASLPESWQAALRFAWQWLRGNERFTVATSGSTGPPKPLTITREQMLVSVRLTQQALQLTQQHTALLCLNASTIGGTMMIARALHLGMDMEWVAPAANPFTASSRPADFVAMVPLQVQTVLAETPARLSSIHALLVGGAPVSQSLEAAIRTRVTSPVYSTYGMTETLSHIALRRLNGPEARAAFHVLGDTQISTDARACLTIRGAITQQRLVVTNDLVELLDQRRFRWLGRYDWVINSGGVKVSPERVERTIEPIVAAASPLRFFVTGLPDERLGERVVLVLEGAPAPQNQQAHLLQTMKQALPAYHAPREIHYVHRFRETPSGKVDRRATVADLKSANR